MSPRSSSNLNSSDKVPANKGRTAMLGALAGMTVLAGTVGVLGSSAFAAEDPSLTQDASTDSPAVESGQRVDDTAELDAELFEIERELAEFDTELEKLEVCVDAAIAKHLGDEFDLTEAEEDKLSDAEIDALDEAFESKIDIIDSEIEACEAELPDEVKDFLDSEFEEFDDMPAVAVETPEGATFVDFGEGDATVTITKAGDDITVTTDGDATSEAVEFDELEDWDDSEFDELEDWDDSDFDELERYELED